MMRARRRIAHQPPGFSGLQQHTTAPKRRRNLKRGCHFVTYDSHNWREQSARMATCRPSHAAGQGLRLGHQDKQPRSLRMRCRGPASQAA